MAAVTGHVSNTQYKSVGLSWKMRTLCVGEWCMPEIPDGAGFSINLTDLWDGHKQTHSLIHTSLWLLQYRVLFHLDLEQASFRAQVLLQTKGFKGNVSLFHFFYYK